MNGNKKYWTGFGTNRFNLGIMLLLCIINLVIYFPTINGYFLADDFMHISYLADVFHRQPLLLLSNFHTNWMQAVGTQFYRPLITLTLAFDYFFWGSNAIGFHLSNLLFQIISTLLLYFLVREMTANFEEKQSQVISTVAAIFFAVYPLHPEAVSWIIGRVDSIATLFYLAAFLLFLKYNKIQSNPKQNLYIKHIILGCSLACYFCSLLSKEIAITLPLALWLWLFIFNDNTKNFGDRFVSATKGTAFYWLLLAIYLAIRTSALGTLYGGYSGSIGAGLNLSFINRFFGESSLARLIFPFNEELFSHRHPLRVLLAISYSLAVVLFTWRLLNKQTYIIPYKHITFGLLWFAVCLLPTYQVFDLTPNLQGSRLVYLASAPVCFLLSVLLTPIVHSSSQSALLSNESTDSRRRTWTKGMNSASSALCVIILIVFTFTTYINNLPWRRAGDELKELQQAFLKEKETLSSEKKLILINIPYTCHGAHMLYNGTTLGLLCSLGHKISNPLITLEPVLYGDTDLLNCGRLERLLKNKSGDSFFVWQRNAIPPIRNSWLAKCLHQLQIGSIDSGHLKIFEIKDYLSIKTSSSLLKNRVDSNPTEGKLITISSLEIPTAREGLLEISAKADPLGGEHTKIGWLRVRWNSKNSNTAIDHGTLTKPLITDGSTHKYLFNLSEHKSWLLCNSVDQLEIDCSPDVPKFQIDDISFINPANKIPMLDYDEKRGPREDSTGVCHSSKRQGFCFSYDATQINGAQAVVYEISKPNFWFEHNDETFTSNRLSSDATVHRKLPNLKGEFTIPSSDLQTGYFEVRIAAVDSKGNMIGLTSYPICGQMSKE